jgi:hypothetical protein
MMTCSEDCNIVKPAPRGLKPHATKWVTHAVQHQDPATFYVVPKLHKPKLGFRPIAAAHSYPLAAWYTLVRAEQDCREN